MTNNIFKSFSILVMVLYSLISCRDTFSETGDLLKDINYNAHTMGDQRYLYQETTSADTIAEYKYAGKQLIQIKGIDRMTYMSYSGDQVNQIRHIYKTDADSTHFTQNLIYNIAGSGKLDKITEQKSFFVFPTTPQGNLLETKYYAEYDITYNGAGKVATILKKEATLLPDPCHPHVQEPIFVYQTYKRIILTYDATNTNVVASKTESGAIDHCSMTLSAPVFERNYEYLEYDGLKSPYKLLPYEYLIFRISQAEDSYEGYIFSPQTPEILKRSGTAIPVPQELATSKRKYDKDNYLTLGWFRVFEYRPL